MRLADIAISQLKPYYHPLKASLDPIIKAIRNFNCYRCSETVAEHVQVVLIGEASHGTHEFYATRAELTKRLILERGFTIVACEADWPDMEVVDNFILQPSAKFKRTSVGDERAKETVEEAFEAFTRFPQWMWKNTVVRDFALWARDLNASREEFGDQVRMAGLDVYSLFSSLQEICAYLKETDASAYEEAKKCYACFEPYTDDPSVYALETMLGMSEGCKKEVLRLLHIVLKRREELIRKQADGEAEKHAYKRDLQFKAEINALVARDAEQYYRAMISGGNQSWNQRDLHMIRVLQQLTKHYSQFRSDGVAKVVVWAHNSHIGDASQTDMGKKRREWNIGQLCREVFQDKCFNIGQLTYTGTVACATDWSGPMAVKPVRPGREESFENVFYQLGYPMGYVIFHDEVRKHLQHLELIERYIGVIYRPETELISHYSRGMIAKEYDAVIFHERTSALQPF